MLTPLLSNLYHTLVSGVYMTIHEDISNRAFQLMRFIEYKYVSILEDIIAEESEIMSKPDKSVEDEIRLIGLRAIKKYIADELGIPYLPLNEYEESILEYTSGVEEAEAEA